METIEEAQNRLEITTDGKNGFFRGVLWANHWFDCDEILPQINNDLFSDIVLTKSDDFSGEVCAYYVDNKVWRLYPSSKIFKPTHWRPIKRN